jgi:hypothetical protein
MEFLNEDKRIWNDLTDDEKGRLLVAFHYGKIIEVWDGETWRPTRKKGEWVSPFEEFRYIFRIKPEPVKQVHWANDYENGLVARWHRSRDIADLCSLPTSDSPRRPARIAVIRREIVDGVINYYKEDV